MKLTSGRRKQERQSRALDRLLAVTLKEGKTTDQRNREIATLRQRTGRLA